MPKRILPPLLLAVLLAASSLPGPGRAQNANTAPHPSASAPSGEATRARHHPRVRTVQSVMTQDETEELAESFRAAYNLAAAPDLAAVGALPLNPAGYRASARGVVIREKYDELYLDTTPCEPQTRKKQIYTFNAPYKKEEGDEIMCPNSSVKIKTTRVVQRDRRRLAR